MRKTLSKYPDTFWTIEHLFGSVTRTRLLRIFLSNPNTSFFMRDLARRINTQLNAVRRELENLKNLGIVESRVEGQKKFYKSGPENMLFPELKALILKAQMVFEKNLGDVIDKLGHVYLLLLTGKFVGIDSLSADMLLVGRVNRQSLKKVIDVLQKDFGEQINYTIMTREEYNYRREVTDKFLLDVLDSRGVTLINRLNK